MDVQTTVGNCFALVILLLKRGSCINYDLLLITPRHNLIFVPCTDRRTLDSFLTATRPNNESFTANVWLESLALHCSRKMQICQQSLVYTA